ncbi:hypothetical protein BT96DRAFT_490104 [Gymnopus androsaceus JB14]|uniref:Uncharacterized protein n=1 Tax=Gymnopus androsaceus JB14 TaxID=1447944 RepID=A0A6A4HVV0_9AGAR|nr:hypothetical protein BT96DRAFT_490104 [Gymnopus androsaceus JB14]
MPTKLSKLLRKQFFLDSNNPTTILCRHFSKPSAVSCRSGEIKALLLVRLTSVGLSNTIGMSSDYHDDHPYSMHMMFYCSSKSAVRLLQGIEVSDLGGCRVSSIADKNPTEKFYYLQRRCRLHPMSYSSLSGRSRRRCLTVRTTDSRYDTVGY